MTNKSSNGEMELLDRVSRLGERAEKLSDTIEQLVRKAAVNRRLIITIVIGFLLDIALTITLTFVVNNQNRNTERIDSLTQQLQQEQTIQKVKALCPLYQLFINVDSPKARDFSRQQVIAQGGDPSIVDKEWTVIYDSYNSLSCKDFVTKVH